jgi:hypothetical protein
MINRLTLKLSLVLFGGLFLVQPYMQAQTCSCATTPLFNPIDYSTLKNRKWHFELAYKYHALNDLVEGTKEVKDETERKRTAQNLLLDIRYALFTDLTFRAVFSIARHDREVGISSALPVNTQGFGDSMLSVQYTPLSYSEPSQTQISFGTGIKMPLGKSDARTIGIAAEDMQPGTGSWDTMVWAFIGQLIPQAPGLELLSGVSARFNGANSREYQFGNEIMTSLGAKYHTKKILSYSVSGRYRWTQNDERFGGDVPNTGGQWIYLVPGVEVRLTRDFGFKAEGEIPLYRKLKGARQFTTTFLLSFSVFYEI